MDEQVRHRAVQALGGQGCPSADTTQWHLGHALGRKAGNEAVAQVDRTADVDVAHRVVVGAEAFMLGELVSWKAVGFNVHLMDIKTRDSYDSAGWRGSDAGQVVRGGFDARLAPGI